MRCRQSCCDIKPPLPRPPLGSHQVSSADKEGKQGVCKLVRKPHRTNKCIDSEANGQRGSVTIDPAIGRVNYAWSSIRRSLNILGRAVPGVSHANRDAGRDQALPTRTDQSSRQIIGRGRRKVGENLKRSEGGGERRAVKRNMRRAKSIRREG